jgi:hypothetical protein
VLLFSLELERLKRVSKGVILVFIISYAFLSWDWVSLYILDNSLRSFGKLITAIPSTRLSYEFMVTEHWIAVRVHVESRGRFGLRSAAG